jgi:hypothetical protein
MHSLQLHVFGCEGMRNLNINIASVFLISAKQITLLEQGRRWVHLAFSVFSSNMGTTAITVTKRGENGNNAYSYVANNTVQNK